MRKISRKGLIKKLDALAREIVYKRDGYRCVQCGSTENLSWGHVFSRRTYNTRWDIHPGGNTYCQCWPCNYRHVRDQYPMFRWFEITYGKEALEELRRRFSETHRWTTANLETVREYLEDNAH